MPEHTSFFSYLVAMFPQLGENMHNFGATFLGHEPVSAHQAEPLAGAFFIALLLIALAFAVKGKLRDYDNSVIPDDKLTLRTFFEILIGYFYTMMKDMMGPTRAKKFFPVVGTAACFVVFSNFLGLIPGFTPPTSSWNVTAGCAIVMIAAFTFYGFKENGIGFITHLAGPWMGWGMVPVNLLIFVIEFVSTFIIRPITLSIRLMLNMAVDHLLIALSLGAFSLFAPLPAMVLSTLVCIVQVLVFCMLSSIYIALATEHAEHGDASGHGTEAHGH